MSDLDLTEAIEAAMRASYEARRQSVPDHHPYKRVTWEAACAEARESYRGVATRHVAAALPHLREQLAAQIEALPNLSMPGHFATRPIELIRKDTAARIVRGGDPR